MSTMRMHRRRAVAAIANADPHRPAPRPLSLSLSALRPRCPRPRAPAPTVALWPRRRPGRCPPLALALLVFPFVPTKVVRRRRCRQPSPARVSAARRAELASGHGERGGHRDFARVAEEVVVVRPGPARVVQRARHHQHLPRAAAAAARGRGAVARGRVREREGVVARVGRRLHRRRPRRRVGREQQGPQLHTAVFFFLLLLLLLPLHGGRGAHQQRLW